MLVDSHCHLDRLDLKPYGDDFRKLIESTVEGGVGHMLCVSIDLESYPSMLALVEEDPRISVSVGVHPNEKEGLEPSVEELVSLSRHPKNVAIGETGLDYFRSQGDLEWQRNRFRRHIVAALEVGKPLIIHSRAAQEDTLRIMREEGAKDAGGVMHCFTEDWEMARQALDLGFYISFSGIVTFNRAADLREVAKKVPLNRLLIETDAPYLAPVPFRGKPNQPSYVKYVADCIAEVRNMAPEALAEVVWNNFTGLFGNAVGRGRQAGRESGD